MLRIFKSFCQFISCKKNNEIQYEQILPPKDITPSEPVKIPIVKNYDYNYGTRYY